jgi:hypothetical protein
MRCTSKFGATEAEDLCEIGGIPPEYRKRFKESFAFHVSEYEAERTAQEIEEEIRAVCSRVEDALSYYQSEGRPGEFRGRMVDISNQLKKLSKPALDYLAYRNVRLSFEIPEDGPRAFDVVVDPACFATLGPDQMRALTGLFGALSGPIARKRSRGRPRKEKELALYIFLRGAFLHATKGKASQDDFLAVCEEIKRICGLTKWRPESLARLLRKRLGAAG